MMRALTVAVAAAIVLPQTAHAQEAGSPATRDFIRAVAESDTFETMAAYSALAQSKNPQILAFARAMLRDHGEMSRALTAAARRAGLEPPTMQVGAAQAPLLASLQSMRGVEFDRTYWRQQALAHRSALTIEQKYVAAGDTPAIQQAAAAALPVIEAHLSMAEKMNAKTGPQGNL